MNRSRPQCQWRSTVQKRASKVTLRDATAKYIWCKKVNHFATMCRTRDQQVHEVNDNPYQVSDSLFVEAISEVVNQVNQVFVNIEIGNKKTPVRFQPLVRVVVGRVKYGGGLVPPGRYGSHEGLSGTLKTAWPTGLW